MNSLLGRPVLERADMPDIPTPRFSPLDSLNNSRIVIVWFPKTIRRHFTDGARKAKGGSMKRYKIYFGHDLLRNELVVRGKRPNV